MNDSIDRSTAHEDDRRPAHLTRRTVLAGAAATTATVTIGTERAAALDSLGGVMLDFVNLSVALTGITQARLAPGTDPHDLKQLYFDWVMKRKSDAFNAILKIARDNAPPSSSMTDAQAQAIISKSQASPDTQFLARSIVLMWYLGSWYEPDDLKRLVDARAGRPMFIPHTVISPLAYTQGWLWRVIQAHPMGYSDMQFGYWTRAPVPAQDIFLSH